MRFLPVKRAKDADHSQLVSVDIIYQWNEEKAILRSVGTHHPSGRSEGCY